MTTVPEKKQHNDKRLGMQVGKDEFKEIRAGMVTTLSSGAEISRKKR